MHYVPDTEGIRDKREKITEIKEDIQIANLEKQKDLIQDEIDALEEQKDLIKQMMEESKEYYNSLIKELESSADKAGKAAGNAIGDIKNAVDGLKDNIKPLSYYIWTDKDDFALISAQTRLIELNRLVDEQPGKYENLRDEVARFVDEFGRLKETRQVTDELSGSLDALVNSNDEYLGYFQTIVAGVEERIDNTDNYSKHILETVKITSDEIHDFWQTLEKSNEDVGKLVSDASNLADGVSNSVDNAKEGINSLTGTVADAVLKASENTEQLNGAVGGISDAVFQAAENTSANFNNLAEDVGSAGAAISAAADDVGNALNSMSNGENIEGMANTFHNLGDAILEISTALGIGEEDSVGGLVSALSAINEISFDDGIVTQFNNLKSAVDEASSAIAGFSGSGGMSGTSGGSDGARAGAGSGVGNGSGGASSLTGAIEQLKQTADEALGSGGDEGEGVIDKFVMLKTAVDAVTTAIGLGGGEGEGSGEGENLISAIISQYETASEVLPEEKSLFENLLSSIMACVSALNEMKSALSGISSIGIPSVGGGYAEGTVGKAFAKGTGRYKGLPKDEKNALRSEYGQPELTVYPNGTTELTTQPIMSDLPKGTVIFNEEQTKRIMNGKPTVIGTAHTNGTSSGEIITADGQILRPIQPGDQAWELQKSIEPLLKKMGDDLEYLAGNAMAENNRQLEKMMNHLNTTNVVTNNKPSVSIGDIHVTCPGVTEQQVAEHLGGVLGKELDRQFNGFHNYTDQMSRIG